MINTAFSNSGSFILIFLPGFKTVAGHFVFCFSWWARKAAKEPSPAPLIFLTGGLPWRGKNSLDDRIFMIDK
ncbi:MAG: hypothetical protein WAX48_10690 [Desulfosalsimonadaceae bacterium]